MSEGDLEERLARAGVIAEAVEKVERATVVVQRLLVGEESSGAVSGLQQVVDGSLGVVCFRKVEREQPVHLLEGFAVQFLERLADTEMEIAPALLHEALVRCFLEQPMAKAVLRRRPPPFLDDELEPL